MGPVIPRKQMDGVLGYIGIGLDERAKLVAANGVPLFGGAARFDRGMPFRRTLPRSRAQRR